LSARYHLLALARFARSRAVWRRGTPEQLRSCAEAARVCLEPDPPAVAADPARAARAVGALEALAACTVDWIELTETCPTAEAAGVSEWEELRVRLLHFGADLVEGLEALDPARMEARKRTTLERDPELFGQWTAASLRSVVEKIPRMATVPDTWDHIRGEDRGADTSGTPAP
jgi:hypothetical protein